MGYPAQNVLQVLRAVQRAIQPKKKGCPAQSLFQGYPAQGNASCPPMVKHAFSMLLP